MKNQVEELAVSLDVTAITPKLLAASIEEVRRCEKVWGQFYRINSDLMRNGGSQVEFPKKGTGISVSWGLTAGAGVSASSMTYDATTIAIKKGGIGIGLNGEAIRQANRDVIADQIQEAGLVWRDTLDLVAMEAMFPAASFAATANSLIVATGTYWIGIKNTIGDFSGITATSSIVLNSAYSSIAILGAASAHTLVCWYVKSGLSMGALVRSASSVAVANGKASVSAKDILLAKSGMAAYKFTPDFVVMHPDMFAEVIYDPTVKFVERAAYSNQGVPFNGEIGKLWDMKVIVNISMPKWAVALICSKDLGYEILRKELDLKRDEYTGASMDVLYFWGFGERNFGVVNTRAYGVVATQGTLDYTQVAIQTVT